VSGRFRLAIVGAGQIADSHVAAAVGIPAVEIVALVDPAPERARSLAQRYALAARIVPRLADALGGIDGAVIATPNDSHAPLALECVAARVPVLVEKPLATSFAAGERVVAAADAAGVTLAVGYTTRFQWNVCFMRELLRAGALGRPRRFAYQFGFPGGWSSYTGYHLDRRAVGGGVLVTTGTHFLDRMIDWFGIPTAVDYADDSAGGPEANARAAFRFGEDATSPTGTARFSRTVKLPGGIVLETDEGVAILREDPASPVRFRPRAHTGVESELRPRGGPGEAASKSIFRLQLEDFVEACRGGREPRATGRAGLESLRLVAALYAVRQPLQSDPYHPLAPGTP